METEVLVYLQKVKSYLNTNQQARDYFIGESDVDEFYKQLTIISNKNYEKNGEPELTVDQFELLRKTVLALAMSKKKFFYSDDKLFLFFEDFPPISMN